MRYIILLSGYSCSGKDFFADYLVKNSNFTKLSFATELKKYTAKKYKFDYNLTLTQEGKRELIPYKLDMAKSVRELLIDEAMFLREQKGADIFAKYVANSIIDADVRSIKNERIFKNIVISDFRFENEFTYLKRKFHNDFEHSEHNFSYTTNSIKAIVTKVLPVRINRFYESPVDSESEYQLDKFPFDYIIDNISSLGTFTQKINEFYSSLKK